MEALLTLFAALTLLSSGAFCRGVVGARLVAVHSAGTDGVSTAQ